MSEDAGDSRFLLFCKDDADRPSGSRWCGVVVARRPVEHGDGEVIDAVLRATEAALLSWFDGWQDGWRAAEFDSARKDERPMTVDEIIASLQANPDCLIASGVRVLVDEVLRLRSEAVNADLLAALRTVLDQVDYMADPPNCRLNEMVGAVLPQEVIALARAAIDRAEPPAPPSSQR